MHETTKAFIILLLLGGIGFTAWALKDFIDQTSWVVTPEKPKKTTKKPETPQTSTAPSSTPSSAPASETPGPTKKPSSEAPVPGPTVSPGAAAATVEPFPAWIIPAVVAGSLFFLAFVYYFEFGKVARFGAQGLETTRRGLLGRGARFLGTGTMRGARFLGRGTMRGVRFGGRYVGPSAGSNTFMDILLVLMIVGGVTLIALFVSGVIKSLAGLYGGIVMLSIGALLLGRRSFRTFGGRAAISAIFTVGLGLGALFTIYDPNTRTFVVKDQVKLGIASGLGVASVLSFLVFLETVVGHYFLSNAHAVRELEDFANRDFNGVMGAKTRERLLKKVGDLYARVNRKLGAARMEEKTYWEEKRAQLVARKNELEAGRP